MKTLTNIKISLVKILRVKSIIPILMLAYMFVVIIFTLINPLFISVLNLKTMFAFMAMSGIAAIGTTFVIITGNFDISVGSIMGVTGVLVARIISSPNVNIPIPFIIIIGLLVGLSIGALNGFIVTVMGLNSVIATIGTLFIFRGIAYILGMRRAIQIFDDTYLTIGRGFLWDIPYTFIYMIFLLLIMYTILKFTKLGRYFYFVGGNSFVSNLYGIKVRKIKFLSFIISGLTASISGIIIVSMTGLGKGDIGSGYEFKVITLCVLGGISISGGRGSLIGVLIAIFIIGSLVNGLVLADIPLTMRGAVEGIILIIAILFDRFRSRETDVLSI